MEKLRSALLSIKCLCVIFSIAYLIEFLLSNTMDLKKDFIQIAIDIISLIGCAISIVLAKTASTIAEKLKVISKTITWNTNKDAIIQELTGCKVNIIDNKIYNQCTQSQLITLIERVNTYHNAFDEETQKQISNFISLLKEDIQCKNRNQVSTELSSIIGKINTIEPIDRLIDISY